MRKMRGKNGTAWLAAAIILVIPLMVWSYSSNPPLGNTSAPSQNHCQTCHGSGLGGGNVSIAFSGGGTTYTPGVPQTLTITVNDPNSTTINYGFEMTAWEGTVATTPGTFAPVSANVSPPATSTAYPGQVFERHSNANTNTFQVTWTPPASTVYSGPVVFYAASIAGDGNQGELDSLYQTSHTLTAVATPNLTVSPSTLTFNYQIGGTAPTAQNVAVTSSGAALSYTATSSTTSGGNWLAATPASSTTPGTESVSVNTTGLAVGTYTGTVSVASPAAGNSPQTVAVTLHVTAAAPNLTVSPSTLTFNYQIGGTAPAAQNVAVTSSGAALSYTATSSTTSGGNWLAATPTSSTTPGTESVSVNTTGLAVGTYTGTVSVASPAAGNSPQTVAVTLHVTAATAPNLIVSPATLSYSYQIGGTAPTAQNVAVTSSGAALSYTATSSTTSGGNWLAATPASSTTPGTESVSVNTTGLAVGTYTGTVSVASPAAGNSPQTVAVTLHVTAATAPNLIVSPATLSYSYQIGGTVPAAQNVAVTSSGAALSYTVASSQTWLVPTPLSGTTPGSLSVAINPAGLTAGAHTGTVTVTAAGAANSPQTVAVTLTVTAATAPSLHLSPATLSYSYQVGGTVPAAQNVAVTSSGAALSYTVASSQTWLVPTPASGTTPGTLSVAVNPTGLAAGTHTGTVTVTATGAANSPQTVTVTLTITNQGSGQLIARPKTLSFSSGSEQEDDNHGSPSKRLLVTSRGAPLHFTAQALGGSWLSVSPSGGTTPGRLTVTVFPTGLAKGTYTGHVKLSAPGANSITVPVTLTVSHDGEDDNEGIGATTYTQDAADSGAVAARWVYGAGVPDADLSDPTNQGLLLSNNASAASKARAGVILDNVGGITLSVLGFDLRQGSLCTANGPRFIVVTTDNVVHTVGGCNPAKAQASPAKGWMRLRFDPAQAKPAIAPDSTVKSIALMLDDGPESGGGMVVLDNINVNGTFIGHD